MYIREIEAKIQDQIKKGKSVFLLGPRQVGKTTLCRKLRFDLEINLASNMERLKFEKDPESDALDAAMNNKFGNNKLSMLILKKQIKR
jgi:predicted AAA+ superfamily ATPase